MLIGELDSYMFQTVGHEGISLYAEAMQIPLFQEITQGKTTSHDMLDYQPQKDDEVEDLYRLLQRVKVGHKMVSSERPHFIRKIIMCLWNM